MGNFSIFSIFFNFFLEMSERKEKRNNNLVKSKFKKVKTIREKKKDIPDSIIKILGKSQTFSQVEFFTGFEKKTSCRSKGFSTVLKLKR